jgi:superfamily I DNA/RNA helicase
LDEVKKFLNKSGIKYLDLSNPKNDPGAIRLSTFHNLKGHEFKVLFAKGVSEDTVPLRHMNYVNLLEKEKEEYEQQERSLYYVVFSRAIQAIHITGVGERKGWFR